MEADPPEVELGMVVLHLVEGLASESRCVQVSGQWEGSPWGT